MVFSGAVKVKTPIFRSTVCSGAIALMLCCAEEAKSGNAFAASPQLVEFEAAPQALNSSHQQPGRERGQVRQDVPGGDRLQGFLTKHEEDGPYPEIVALH